MTFKFDSRQAEFFFKHAHTPMLIVGLDNRILEANKAATEDLGYSNSEYRAMLWTDFTHPLDINPDQEEIDRAIERKEPYRMVKRYRPKGSHGYEYRLLIVVPYTDENGVFCWFASQITAVTHKGDDMRDLVREAVSEAMATEVTSLIIELMRATKRDRLTESPAPDWFLRWFPVIKWAVGGLIGIGLMIFAIGKWSGGLG